MLLTRLKVFLLGALVLGIISTSAFTQGPSRGKGGRMDPEEMFKLYANGKDVLVVAEATVPEQWSRFMTNEQLREGLNAYLDKKGIRGGRMTLEQFKEYNEERQAARMAEGATKMAEKTFGFLSQGAESIDVATLKIEPWMAMGQDPEKMRGQMKEFLEKKGVKDGKMTRELYADYSKGMIEALRAERAKSESGDQGKSEKSDKSSGERARGRAEDYEKPKTIPEEKRIVYRVGNLPKDLPAWFKDYDKDSDGQIGLYEWKKADKPVASFLAMDANGDGFVTVEEVLRFEKVGKPAASKTTTLVKGPVPSSPEKGKEKGQGKRGQQDPEAYARERFTTYDTNKDNKLSVEEMESIAKTNRMSQVHREWKKYDKNNNGAIELDEYTEYMRSRMGGRKR